MRFRTSLILVTLALISSIEFGDSTTPSTLAADTAKPDLKHAYATKVWPLLQQYCITCHNDKKMSAGLTLEGYKDEVAAMKDRKTFEKVRQQLFSREMPPKNKPQPKEADRDEVAQWIGDQLTKIECGLNRDPGRPTIRRLNRAEYNNTIRDLVGVNFLPAADFPTDDVGYGFDNIGDVLSMPPILLEKYLAAADKILDQAIVINKPIKPEKSFFRPQNLISTLGKESKQKNRIMLHSNGAAIQQFEVLHEGEYLFRAKAYGDRAGDQLPKMALQVDRKDQKVFDVDAKDKAKVYEVKVQLTAGKHAFAAAFTNDFVDEKTKADRNLYVEGLELEGPFNAAPKPLPESHKKIMIAEPQGLAGWSSAAERIIENFTKKAYRRPVKKEEIARLMTLYKRAEQAGEPFEKCIQYVLKAVLVSPHFLFRIEIDERKDDPNFVHAVNDYELASRLSYFLWSTMPDDELFRLAANKTLHEKDVLIAQTRRMLKDPKATSLTDNFASQWLQLRTLDTLSPDRQTYPTYDSALKNAMVRETELYFEHILKEDRSVLEFLDSDYTFVNGRLARHYGIEGVKGPEFQKVKLTDKNRGGIFGQASFLTLTSNPTRTSPVKRGKWILENILGTPPPPPDPDAGMLEESKEVTLKGTLRQRMEQHRANPNCAVCHQKMDPLGFGLENFDGVGSWRTMDGKFPIDSSGDLPGGLTFKGPRELRNILLGKADLFRRCLSEKMLTFAIGRGLEYYDKCALDDISKNLAANEDRFSALVIGIVQSEPFLKRKAKRSE